MILIEICCNHSLRILNGRVPGDRQGYLTFDSNSGNGVTVVIRYNTIGGVHKYESCYKPIVLYEMARFYLVLLDMI